MTTATIKAILIDPFTKTITPIDMPDDFDAMKADYIKCDLAEAMDFGDGVTAWFDEEGMLVGDWSEQGFTRFCDSVTLAGRIVLTGERMTDDGKEMADLPAEISIPFIWDMAVFIPHDQVRVPGMSISTVENGVVKTEAIGPEFWTHDNH